MDEFNEEPNEAHDGKPDGRGHSDLLEFLSIGFRTSLDQSDTVLDELFTRFDEGHDLIH